MTRKKLLSLKKIALLVAPLALFGCYHSYAAPEQPFTQTQKNQEETTKVLQKLTQYAIDESFLISQCIDNLSNQEIKNKLHLINSKCADNIKELSALLVKYGGNAPDYSKDFKGYFMSGYAAMRGVFTDQGTLNALHTNLKLILKAFDSALNSSVPADVKEAVKRIYEDNKKAIQTIETQI